MDFASLLLRACADYAEKPAAIFGDLTLTYAGLLARASKLANYLSSRGLRPGDRVAILEDNSPTSLEEICALALGIALGGHAGIGTVAFAILVGYVLAAIFRVLVWVTTPRPAVDVAIEAD